MKEGTLKLLAKAERTIEAGRVLLEGHHPDSAAGRSYYAMFYVAEALLYEHGLKFAKHSGVQSAYGKHFAKTEILDPRFHRWLLEAYNTRLESDYGFDMIPSEEAIETSLEQASAFLEAARAYLEARTRATATDGDNVDGSTEPTT